jgi:hypothetical protein
MSTAVKVKVTLKVKVKINVKVKVKVKVKYIIEQTKKAQRGTRGTTPLFL